MSEDPCAYSVYAYVFDDGHAYVGLTNNLKQRSYNHRYDNKRQERSSPVLKYWKKSGQETFPDMLVLYDGLSAGEAQRTEGLLIGALDPDLVLNKAPTGPKVGSLGGKPRLSAEERKAAKERRRKYNSAYSRKRREKPGFRLKRHEQDLEYRKRHKAEIRKRQREWSERNRERRKEYYLKNRKRLLEKCKAYRLEHHDRICEQMRAYRKENHTSVVEGQRAWYRKNREKALEQKKEYRQKNRDQLNERRRAKRRKAREAPPTAI